MKTIGKVAIGCAFTALLSVGLSSQTPSSQTGATHVPIMTNGYGVSNIAGQSFSADLEIERAQTLADGGHIHTVQHLKFYRDGEGRIRYEMYTHQGPSQESPEEISTIIITDTPANVQYSLSLRAHSGRRNVLFTPPNPAAMTPRPAPRPTPQQSASASKNVSESLGTRSIEGITAEGYRNTTTFPVNYQGNDAPLVTVNEQWRSSEMGLEILRKTSDLRFGDQLQRFINININRTEPDPALFQVPSDYTIKDQQ